MPAEAGTDCARRCRISVISEFYVFMATLFVECSSASRHSRASSDLRRPNAAQVAFTNMKHRRERAAKRRAQCVVPLKCFCFAARTSVLRWSRAMFRRSGGRVEVRLEHHVFS